MATIKIPRIILIFAAIFASAVLVPRATEAFDWPDGATLVQKIQVIKDDLLNAKTLSIKAKSKKAITAASYVAVDMTTGTVLLQKNQNLVYPIASITKLMNAVVTLENNEPSKTVVVTDKMLQPTGTSPAIFKGLKISVGNLLQAALTQSVNDAAESLAYSLGKDKFIALMNQKAKELKMTNTIYHDVSGLDKRNKSTATDMVKLLTYIKNNHPEILATTKNNNFWLPDQEGTLFKFKNLNDFYNYPDFIGGKTGYTQEARQTFAALFDIKGKPVAIVILRAIDYQADTFKIIDKLKK